MGASPTRLPVTSVALISSVSASMPRCTLRHCLELRRQGVTGAPLTMNLRPRRTVICAVLAQQIFGVPQRPLELDQRQADDTSGFVLKSQKGLSLRVPRRFAAALPTSDALHSGGVAGGRQGVELAAIEEWPLLDGPAPLLAEGSGSRWNVEAAAIDQCRVGQSAP